MSRGSSVANSPSCATFCVFTSGFGYTFKKSITKVFNRYGWRVSTSRLIVFFPTYTLSSLGSTAFTLSVCPIKNRSKTGVGFNEPKTNCTNVHLSEHLTDQQLSLSGISNASISIVIFPIAITIIHENRHRSITPLQL